MWTPRDRRGLRRWSGARCVREGAGSFSAADFDEEVAFLAAEIGSSVGATMGQARLNCLTKDLDAALDLFFEMLRHPRFEAARLELAKSQMLQGMERRNDATRSIEGREWGTG